MKIEPYVSLHYMGSIPQNLFVSTFSKHIMNKKENCSNNPDKDQYEKITSYTIL